MMARFLVLAGVAALTLATASPAEAQTPPKSSGKTSLMKRLDTDNDGTLDLAEVKKAAAAKFRRLDGDKDGTLDKKEAKAAGIGAKAFSAADPDKDGTLDEAEYMKIVEQRFKAADPDNDGTLDEKELSSRAGKALMKMVR